MDGSFQTAGMPDRAGGRGLFLLQCSDGGEPSVQCIKFSSEHQRSAELHEGGRAAENLLEEQLNENAHYSDGNTFDWFSSTN